MKYWEIFRYNTLGNRRVVEPLNSTLTSCKENHRNNPIDVIAAVKSMTEDILKR